MMMQNREWNWIFDWSGTLVDDMALVLCATNHVMRSYGKPEFQREDFRKSFRLPYEEFYAEHIPGVELEEIEAHFRHGFAISKETVPVLPYAESFLRFLHKNQNRMYVLTSMCEVAFGEQVEDLDLSHFFEKTYAGVLDKRLLIHQMIELHDMDVNKTIFVGDMTHDVETAHHGGIHSAAVLTGYNHREILEAVSPSVLFENLAEFQQVLTDKSDWQEIFVTT